MTKLRLALIGGPQYDQIQQLLEAFTVDTGIALEVVYRGDHPALNRRMAVDLPAGEPLDLISTHSKYAPSQSPWLRPLDGLVDVRAFEPRALELCSFQGTLLCMPRMVDVRLLWLRRDIAGDRAPPETWTELLSFAEDLTWPEHAGYAFPGKESGLFGTFYELVVAEGGDLFDEDVRPTFTTPEADDALGWLVEAHRVRKVTPAALPDWHYDEVSESLRTGTVAMIGDWPAFYGHLEASPVRDVVDVSRYPAGAAGRAVYAGVHGYAIPQAAAHPKEAVRLLEHLVCAESLRLEAAAGPIPPRRDVEIPVASDLDRRRAELLRETIAHDMLTFPPLERYPEIEDAGWQALRSALQGDLTVDEALGRVQEEAERVLEAAD